MRKTFLVGYIFIAIIFGITAGIIAHMFNDSVLEQATLKEVEIANKFKEKEQNIVQTISTEVKTTPNTNIIYETLYNQCSDVETYEENVQSADVNKDENYFKSKYSDWEINEFSENIVRLSKHVDGICNKHYIVKEKDGYIAIYTLDSLGNENLKEITDILTQYLPEDDITLLRNGIKVNGDNDLMKTLSDFE